MIPLTPRRNPPKVARPFHQAHHATPPKHSLYKSIEASSDLLLRGALILRAFPEMEASTCWTEPRSPEATSPDIGGPSLVVDFRFILGGKTQGLPLERSTAAIHRGREGSGGSGQGLAAASRC